jgi:hypothetical protein
VNKYRQGFIALGMLVLLVVPIYQPERVAAQQDSVTFPETGKTIQGRFMQYWQEHGGLVQQGYPISDEFSEVSAVDGKTYTVQYFERAVFEAHPENAAPNDVLLSLLGVFQYNLKYPGGAPNQAVSEDANVRSFPQTGHSVGGRFLDYWTGHGGLAQQGYPISDLFQEKSDLDGKTYTVQYFERAVFEAHPENAAPNDVLLSQLGTFQYERKYQQPSATPTTAAPAAQPTATAAPVEPTATPDLCSGIPANQNAVVTPTCGPAGTEFNFSGSGFLSNEKVGLYTTSSNGTVYGTPSTANADKKGNVSGWHVPTTTSDPTGIWAITMEGLSSHRKAIGYFKVTPFAGADCSGIPTNLDASVTPNCGPAGTAFKINAHGFKPGEIVDRFYKDPTGRQYGGSSNVYGVDNQGNMETVTYDSYPGDPLGVYSAYYTGRQSGHQSVAFFKVTAP